MPAPLFPYAPNWRTPVTERLEWLTDVFEAHDTTEQRTPLRSFPRRALSYELAVHGASAQRLDAWLWRYQAAECLLPIWTDPQRLAAELPAGAASIPAMLTGYDFAAGQWAVLMHGGETETVEVEALDTETGALTLAAPTVNTWPAGGLLYPARLARLPADVAQQRHTAAVATGALEFELVNGAGTAAPSANEYRGVEVATRRPDWAAGVPAQYLRKVQRLDYALGVIHIDDLAELPITVRSHRFAFARRAAIADWRGWLHAREGRANGFWQPQWQMDLTQTGAIAADGLELRVRAVDYRTRYAADPGRQDLALLHRSGTWYFRRVLSASTLGEDELLELDAALGIEAAPGDFTLITWLVPSRLDTDEVELTWHTAGVVTSTVDIRSLRTP